MIKLIEKGNILPFKSYNNLFNSKILCIYETYGFTKFTDFWEQNGSKAVIARIDNSFIIDTCSDANFTEIESFIKTVCTGNVLCSEKILINDLLHTKGYTMVLKNKNTPIKANDDLLYTDMCSFMNVYDLLNSCKSSDFTPPDYESLVLDVGNKLNKNKAIIQCAYQKDKLISFAMANVCTKSAYITSVAVDKNFRRMGIGSSTVLKLINRIDSKKDIFLQRVGNKSKEFYESIGFEDKEQWIEYRL